MKSGSYLGLKILNRTKKFNQKYTENKDEIVDNILDLNIDKLSDKQKKMLHCIYLENLRDGLKFKDAIDRAYQIAICFKI